MVTVTGPSGAGKTTIVGELLKRHPDWKMVRSETSRGLRDSDLPGEYRCNVTDEEFFQIKEEKRELWIETAHGNIYATLKVNVTKALLCKGVSFMNLLPVSVRKIRAYIPGRVLSIFILPPNEEELKRRLTKRSESPGQIDRRIADCRKWEEEARLSDIPYEFVRNDRTVEEAVYRVEAIISRYI